MQIGRGGAAVIAAGSERRTRGAAEASMSSIVSSVLTGELWKRGKGTSFFGRKS